MSLLRILAVALLLPIQLLAAEAANSSVELVATLRGHTKTIENVEFSHRGEIVATSSNDKTVRLWSTVTGQHLGTIVGDRDLEVFKLSWSNDDRRLAITYSGKKSREVALWEIPPGQSPVMGRRFEATLLFEWSPNGLTFLTLDHQLNVKVWDASSGRVINTLLPSLAADKSFTVSYVAGGLRILTASHEEPMELWDLATGKRVGTYPPNTYINGYSSNFPSALMPIFSLDRSFLISDNVNVYKAETGELLTSFKDGEYPASFSPDGKSVLTVRFDTEKYRHRQSYFSLRRIDSGQELSVFQVPQGIHDIVWSPEGGTIAIVGLEFNTRIFNTATGRENGRLPYGNCWPWQLFGSDDCEPLKFSADGAVVLKAKEPIKLWDTRTVSLIQVLKPAHFPAAFSPTDAQLLATTSKDKKSLLLWRVKVV